MFCLDYLLMDNDCVKYFLSQIVGFPLTSIIVSECTGHGYQAETQISVSVQIIIRFKVQPT